MMVGDHKNMEYIYIMYIVICNLAPTLKFNQSAYNVDEDDGPAQPVLVLSNPSSTDITISVFSTDGSATGKIVCICLSVNICTL